MGTFDHMFAFYSDVDQQEDIDNLKSEMMALPNLRPLLDRMNARIGKLELLNRTLTELLLSKKIITRDELSVMMQQVDLLDGVEDGEISSHLHANAPTCDACGRYVNPKRTDCVYCGVKISMAAAKRRIKPVRNVDCTKCGAVVPESTTYFGAGGVICETCFEDED